MPDDNTVEQVDIGTGGGELGPDFLAAYNPPGDTGIGFDFWQAYGGGGFTAPEGGEFAYEPYQAMREARQERRQAFEEGRYTYLAPQAPQPPLEEELQLFPERKPLIDLGEALTRGEQSLKEARQRSAADIAQGQYALGPEYTAPPVPPVPPSAPPVDLSYITKSPLMNLPISTAGTTLGQGLEQAGKVAGVAGEALGQIQVFPRVIGYVQQEEDIRPLTVRYNRALAQPGMYSPQELETLRKASERELLQKPHSIDESIRMLERAPEVYTERTHPAAQIALAFIDPSNLVLGAPIRVGRWAMNADGFNALRAEMTAAGQTEHVAEIERAIRAYGLSSRETSGLLRTAKYYTLADRETAATLEASESAAGKLYAHKEKIEIPRTAPGTFGTLPGEPKTKMITVRPIPRTWDEIWTKIKSMSPFVKEPLSKAHDAVDMPIRQLDRLADIARATSGGDRGFAENTLTTALRDLLGAQTVEQRAALAGKYGQSIRSRSATWLQVMLKDITPEETVALAKGYLSAEPLAARLEVNARFLDKALRIYPPPATDINQKIMTGIRHIASVPWFGLSPQYLAAQVFNGTVDTVGKGRANPLRVFTAQSELMRKFGFIPEEAARGMGAVPEVPTAAGLRGWITRPFQKGAEWQEKHFSSAIWLEGYERSRALLLSKNAFLPDIERLGFSADDARRMKALIDQHGYPSTTKRADLLRGIDNTWPIAPTAPGRPPTPTAPRAPKPPPPDLGPVRTLNSEWAEKVHDLWENSSTAQQFERGYSKLRSDIARLYGEIEQRTVPQARKDIDAALRKTNILRPKEVDLSLRLEQPLEAGAVSYTEQQLARMRQPIQQTIEDVRRIASEKGIATAGTTGIPTDRHLLNVLNKHRGEGIEAFTRENLAKRANEATDILSEYLPQAEETALSKKLFAVPEPAELEARIARGGIAREEARRMMLKSKGILPGKETARLKELGKLHEPPPSAGDRPYITLDKAAKAQYDALLHELDNAIAPFIAEWKGGARVPPATPPLGGTRAAGAGYDPHQLALSLVNSKEYADAMGEIDLFSKSYGKIERDFALHDYYAGRYNFDTTIGRVAPFHFWVTREGMTYLSYMLENPGIAAGYFKYHQELNKLNDGLPEQQRDQWRVPGWVPLIGNTMFNVDAAVNPLYRYQSYFENFDNPRLTTTEKALGLIRPVPGLEGVLRRTGVLGKELPPGLAEQTGRVGTQLQQTNALQSLTAYLKEKNPNADWAQWIPPGGVNIEQGAYDRVINPALAAAGINVQLSAQNPYDPTRISRQIVQMWLSGEIDEQTAKNIMAAEQGDLWDEAFTRAYSTRVTNDVPALLFGMRFTKMLPSEKVIADAKGKFSDYYARRDATPDDPQLPRIFKALISQYPWYFAYSGRYKPSEERAGAEIKDIYYKMSELERRRVRNELGVKFGLWIKEPIGTQPSDLSDWIEQLSGLVPAGMPAGKGLRFIPSEQADVDAYAERSKWVENRGGWDRVLSAPKGSTLSDEWIKFERQWKKEHPRLSMQIGLKISELDANPLHQEALAELQALYDKYSEAHGVDAQAISKGYKTAENKRYYLSNEYPWLKKLWNETDVWEAKYPDTHRLRVEAAQGKVTYAQPQPGLSVPEKMPPLYQSLARWRARERGLPPTAAQKPPLPAPVPISGVSPVPPFNYGGGGGGGFRAPSGPPAPRTTTVKPYYNSTFPLEVQSALDTYFSSGQLSQEISTKLREIHTKLGIGLSFEAWLESLRPRVQTIPRMPRSRSRRVRTLGTRTLAI